VSVSRARRAAVCAAAALPVLALLVAAWRSHLVAPAATLLVEDREGRFLGEIGDGPDAELGYWPVEEVPQRVAAATVAIEDRRFRSHPGVDLRACLRAVSQNLRHRRRISGASTLAMQVARMQHPGRRGYLRKAVEAVTAVLMTARNGRDAVLAHYLRIVPYGNRIHGIAYAARRYFDKPVDDLSWAETAFLTAIPQSPARMNPFQPEGRARAARRGAEILDRLLEGGVLTPEEHAVARRQIFVLPVPPPQERPREALHALLRLQQELGTEEARRRLALRPIVRTTLDLEVQDEVAWRAYKAVQTWERDGARNAAVIVLDRATSAVRAWVGSSDYFDASRAGAIDYARVPRSPGSALKPFFYAQALERGALTPATILDDLDRGPGGIVNADGLFLGPLLPRVALGNSRNVPAVEVLAHLGVDEAYGFLRDLGLHRGSEPARRYGLGLAIGGLPVTLEDLVRAYTVFSSEGRSRPLLWYAGQPLEPARRLLSEDAARQVTLFLADPQARLPSFARMGALEYPFPVAVKTGTSSRFRDAWAVAFSTRAVVGVWVGDPDFHPMNRLTGYRSAAALAHDVLLFLHRDQQQGLEDLSFPPPRSARAVRLCALTGRLATDACDRVFVEWLRPGEEPVDACAAHRRTVVDRRTGRPATRGTPPVFVEVRTRVDLPPRYASWLAAAGLPHLSDAADAPPAPRSHGVRLSVTSPEDGLRLLRDPETPSAQATIALKAVVDPPAPQVVWYVDGAPFQVADYPYAVRWPLAPGEHVFQARLAQGAVASRVVRVRVD
jgi:penicillin-binding protein 1C